MVYKNTNYLFIGYIKRLARLAAAGLVLLVVVYFADIVFDIITYQVILRDSQTRKSAEKPYVHDYQDSTLRRFDVVNAKYHFLKQFKNPCFLEKLPHEPLPAGKNVYSNSAYFKFDNYTRKELFAGRLNKTVMDHPQGVLINDTYGICGKQRKCRVRCFPYFMLIGMAKSGTSDFYDRIISHPLVYGGTDKEFFYWSQFRFQISASLGDFSDLFDVALQNIIEKPQVNSKTGDEYYPYVLGDFTSVTFTDDVWWRDHPGNQGLMEPKHLKIHDMYHVLPNVKLIAILRNPSTRLYSSYNMFRRPGKRKPSPEDFHGRVLKSIEWWHNCTVIKGLPRRRCVYGSPPEMPPQVCVLREKGQNNRWYGPPNVANYSGEIRKGMYAIFAKDWYSVYPKEQILILKTEEYSMDPLNTFNQVVLPFLDLPQVAKSEAGTVAKESHSNARSYLPMLQKTRKILDEFYKPFNEELTEFLGDEKWLWND